MGLFYIFVDLESEINDISDQFKSDLFVIIAKRSKGKKNKSDLKLFANSFY